MSRVALVVLNWNGMSDTIRCLESLREVTYPELTVIVVDNGSTDGSVATIPERFPEMQLVALESNRGYTGGNNAGIEKALDEGAEIVGVLNNDTVVSPGFLEPLVEQIDRERSAFVSPRIVYLDNPTEAWFCGSYEDPKVGITYHRPEASLGDAEQHASVVETVAVTGCCLLAHRSLWEGAGLFDDRYFLIFEDADWCARARACGAVGLVVKSSTVAHAVSSSFQNAPSAGPSYYYVRNGLLYLRDHGREPFQSSVRFVARALRDSTRRFVHHPSGSNARSIADQLAGVAAFGTRRFGRHHVRSTWSRGVGGGSVAGSAPGSVKI